MSIWISKPVALIAFLALTGCQIEQALMPSTLSVLGGDMQIKPPFGYCVDDEAGTLQADSAVVLMGRCSAALQAAPAVITTSIGGGGSAAALDQGPVALTSFFSSDQGLAMLSSTGKSGDLALQDSETLGDMVLLHLKDAGLGEYWRGILGVNGRLVMISATGTASTPLAPSAGRKLLLATIKALQKANAAEG